MSDAEFALRKEIIAACRSMSALDINQGTAGNIGVRHGDGLLITPSGIPYEMMAPEDIVWLGFDGKVEGMRAPSSEWRFHRDILAARPDINAVVHTHAPNATAVAMTRRDLPAVHYMIAAAGGSTIRCAPYATFGTEELSRLALEALADRTACLLANHGMIACGPSLDKAMWLAVEIETLARQYVIACQLGDPVILDDDEIAVVVEKFKTYGPRRKDAPA
ncbi:MAG: class II aldolase [Hyphomicrobiales bacterium]|nr:MAG: class II aldolase [Hyphomicrobiales bacterium]